MTRSFEEMKNTKATEVPVSLCKTEAVKIIVREQVMEALKGLDLKAEVSPEYYERMDKLIKRPPLLSLHLNLTAKAFSIIMALLLVLGAAGYVWFVNTPMYLATNYISHMQGSTIQIREQDIPQHTVLSKLEKGNN